MFSFFRKTKEPPKHEVLQQLKALDEYQTHTYEATTEEVITKFQQKLYKTIDVIIETLDDSFYVQAEALHTEATELKEQIKYAHEQLERHKKAMGESVKKGLVFVESTNFYPPEYVFHLNKLEGFILEMTELQEKDPLANTDEFFAFRDQVEQDIAVFSELHRETIALLHKIDEKIAQRQKEETQAMIEIKESLFRALQMGHLPKAKSDLKKLRKEVKRF